MRICKDCIYSNTVGAIYVCENKRIIIENSIIDGTPTDNSYFRKLCTVQRSWPSILASFFNKCGKSGLWFKPKQS